MTVHQYQDIYCEPSAEKSMSFYFERINLPTENSDRGHTAIYHFTFSTIAHLNDLAVPKLQDTGSRKLVEEKCCATAACDWFR